VKAIANQLPLFAEQLATPARVQERVEFCTSCGREIVLQRYASDGLVNEYRSRDGECYARTFGGHK
jgi:hypothetical protein